MPTTPSASATQKELLVQLKTLAQTDAANTANQITAMNADITKYNDGKTLFETRYSYWDDFIVKYEAERQYLDGNVLGSPLTPTDFTNFLAQTGRLINTSLPVPARFTPVRIAEFDSGNTTYTQGLDEGDMIAKEAIARSDLINGFTTPGFPTGINLSAAYSGGATVRVERSTSATFPTSGKIWLSGSSTAAILSINGAATTVSSPPTTTNFVYDIPVVALNTGFGTISIGASVSGTLTGFTNIERTNKTATPTNRQFILNGLIANYTTAITNWKNNLQSQRDAIVAQTGEDAPDSTYITNQLAALTQLINWLPTSQVSDTAFAAIAALASTRTTDRTARVSWINARLGASGSKAWDERYKYADRLYNLSDGAHATINILTGQRDSLVSQQGASNARAAKLADEVF